MIEVGGLKRCSRTEGYSKQVGRRGAETCATMFNKGMCSSRLMKVHPFTDLKKNAKSLISLSYADGKRSN